MKNMKKIVALGLCATMLAAAAALAETTDSSSGATPRLPDSSLPAQQEQFPSDFNSQLPQAMPGMNNQNQAPANFGSQIPGMNNQNQAPANFDGELPALPDGADQSGAPADMNGQLPSAMPGMCNQNQGPTNFDGERPALPDDATTDSERPALPDGADQPDASADMNDQLPPAMPEMNGQSQNGFGQMVVRTGNNGGLRMRREASQDSRILCVYANGTEVDVLEATNGEWVKVQIGNRTGYMMIKFLEEEAPATEVADITLTEETAAE